jgi:hydroxyacylglutathione hydrolase
MRTHLTARRWLWRNCPLIGLALLICSAGAAQPRTDPLPFTTGVLPQSWKPSGPTCGHIPEFQIHQYNEDFFIIRQSGCSNYEKPFLYLIFGREKALLLDTGAGGTNVARVVKTVVGKWLADHRLRTIRLIVAHTHAHGDHTSGDDQFSSLPDTTLVRPNLEAVQTFFGIRNWPKQVVQYDLGGRILDVIPIPGHERTSIAIYDRSTAILLTGDTLYPGRLYVNEPEEYVRSIQRLVDFTQDKAVAHVLGTHIENRRTPYLDYPVTTIYQPDEHVLELGRGQLLELNDALQRMRGHLVRKVMRDFTISP